MFIKKASILLIWQISNSEQQLFNKGLVFVPYNPSAGVHWLLIVLNLLQGIPSRYLLDPMLENNTSDIELVKEIGRKLLKNKFSLQNVTVP